MQGRASVRLVLRHTAYIGAKVFLIKFLKSNIARAALSVRLRTLQRTYQKRCATLVFTLLYSPIDITEVSPPVSGPGSSVGIATDYGLDGPVSNPGGDEIFRTSPDRPWGSPSLL